MSNNRPIIIVKKKGGHAGHHGGAWKVAFADFITALMACFSSCGLSVRARKSKRPWLAIFATHLEYWMARDRASCRAMKASTKRSNLKKTAL